jgi:hypothetical protein
MNQARGLVLEDEVVRAGVERGDRRLFADRPRGDDERQVATALADDVERRDCAEPRERPVRDNDVPVLRL